MDIYRKVQDKIQDGPVFHKVNFNGNHELGNYNKKVKKGFLLTENGYEENISTKNDLVILGGGYVGQAVYELAIWLDIPVIVIDNREEFANYKRFPKAKNVFYGKFDDVLENEKFRKNSRWLIATSGHEYDTVCLSYVLKMETSYIGMIGSKNKIRVCYESLKKMGFSEKDFEKVFAPVGLSIGGNTPREIAVGIIGEIMSIENKEKKVVAIPIEVLEALSIAPKGSVIATIIKSKGSSPRKEGTRLVVFPNGNVIGTIGGGLMEVKVINHSKKLLINGKNEINHFNLDTKAMVCGGEVDVFFEVLK